MFTDSPLPTQQSLSHIYPLFPLALCFINGKCSASAWIYCLAERGDAPLSEGHLAEEEEALESKKDLAGVSGWAQGEEG